jgi:glycosyltransferase involved in cell wall biosynthesis
VVFVCGPFGRGELEERFLLRFAHCRLIGLALSMKEPLEKWNPFDLLIERDSSRTAHADIAFASRAPRVPVVGVCLVEAYDAALVNEVDAAVKRLLASREVARVPISTRLDHNETGLRTASEVESLISRMDVLVTSRLHGLVLALKNGVAPLVIDPERGGAKLTRQAALLGWRAIVTADAMTDAGLEALFGWCLSEEARRQAQQCRDRAVAMMDDIERRLLAAFAQEDAVDLAFAARAGPLVSVVIPCYNQGRYLADAIDSVLAQTYRNHEIIVVDDGSHDETAEVAARYTGVRYVRQDNAGLGAARNSGLRISRGDYLVFLDADDRLLPEALQIGVNGLHVNPDCAFISGHYRYLTADGSFWRQHARPPVEADRFRELLRKNYIGMHATVMYRRQALESVGGFDPKLRSCEDYELYFRVVRGHRVATHDHVVAEYRLHGESLSMNAKRMLDTAIEVLLAQWPQVRENPSYVEALREGIRSNRKTSRMLLMRHLRAHVTSGRWSRAAALLPAVVSYAAAWLRAGRIESRLARRPPVGD